MASNFKQEYLDSFSQNAGEIKETFDYSQKVTSIGNRILTHSLEESKKSLDKFMNNGGKDLGIRWYHPNDNITDNSLVAEICKVLQKRPIYEWQNKNIADKNQNVNNINLLYSCENEKFSINYHKGDKNDERLIVGIPIAYSTVFAATGSPPSKIESAAFIEDNEELFSDVQKRQLAKFIDAQLDFRKEELRLKNIRHQEMLAKKLFNKNIRHFKERI